MLPGRRAPRRAPRALAALVLAGAASACSVGPPAGGQASGPPRVTPTPVTGVAGELAGFRSRADAGIDACALLGLTPARVAQLTGADLPDEPPRNPGELRNICSFGGPGGRPAPPTPTASSTTPTTAAAEDGTEDSPSSAATSPSATPGSSTTRSTTSRTSTTPGNEPTDQDGAPDDGTVTPDSVAVGVIRPGGDVSAALALQPQQLSTLYSCSAVRGTGATPGATAQPGAPIEVAPKPATSYVDCAARPTGGGTEVHTVFVSGRELWHLAVVLPGTPRTATSELEALAGLHRLAEQILD